MAIPKWLDAGTALLFLQAVWRHWKAGLTGGTIMAIVAVFVFATVRNVVQPWGWIILATTLLSAGFAAWKEEHDKVLHLQAGVDRHLAPTTPRIRAERLAEFKRKGLYLNTHIDDPTGSGTLMLGQTRRVRFWRVVRKRR